MDPTDVGGAKSLLRIQQPVAVSNDKSAYSLLGLHKGSSVEEIKQAYVNLVKKYDPEKHTDRFMIIQNAFDRLKDPLTRAHEDVRTFNYIKGEFFFNKDERTDLADEKLTEAIEQLQSKREELGDEKFNPKYIQGLMMRSFKNFQKKLWTEAIDNWSEILKIDPTHRRAKNNILYSYLTLGYSYANHGLFDEAIEVWTEALQMNPDDHRVIHNLALACERAERPKDAGKYWEETVNRWRQELDHQPDNEFLKNCIIEVLRESREVEEEESDSKSPESQAKAKRRSAKSIEDYREILKLNPDDFEAHFKISNLLMKEHNWDGAIKQLLILRKKHPRNIEVMNLLGWAMLNAGKIDEAFTNWRKARVLDPKNYQIQESLIKAHMTMGRMLRDKGLFTPSLVHFKALIRLMPDSAEVHYEIGKTYQAQGNERSAYQQYIKTIELDPKHREARIGVSALKMRR